jgi:shikimate kinase
MRILLIAPPRSGATTFSRWLSKELNLKWINEPFNNNQLNNIELIFEFHTKNNIIAKITGNEYIHTQKEGYIFLYT